MGLDLGFLKAGRWTNKWGRQRFGWEKIKSTQKGEKHNVLHKNHLRFLPQKFLVRGTMAATAHSDPELCPLGRASAGGTGQRRAQKTVDLEP